MKWKICEENKSAEEMLPPAFQDKSGVGVHYMSAYIKPINVDLDDETKVTCKRRGLKVTLGIGNLKGTGLMRRLEVSEDPRVMLQAALKEAAQEIGYTFSVEDGSVYLESR